MGSVVMETRKAERVRVLCLFAYGFQRIQVGAGSGPIVLFCLRVRGGSGLFCLRVRGGFGSYEINVLKPGPVGSGAYLFLPSFFFFGIRKVTADGPFKNEDFIYQKISDLISHFLKKFKIQVCTKL